MYRPVTPPPLPGGMRYNIVYLDPPWWYRDRATSGKRGSVFKYPPMTDEQLLTMPIQSIVADDCAMFLWCTMPRLLDMGMFLKSWGFTYRTVGFVWIKLNRVKLTPFMGMGSWTRANAELCLLATRGKMKRINKGVHSVILEPRPNRHSRKPDTARKRIVELFGDIPRIELFATERVEGWDAWGLGVDNGRE